MKYIFALALLFCGVSYAERVTVQIHHLDIGNTNEEALLFSKDDGKVYRISNNSLLPQLTLAKETQLLAELEVASGKVIAVKKLLPPATTESKSFYSVPDETVEYVPTVINDRNTLNQYLNTVTDPNLFYTRSQCFRRAHVWANDLFQAYKTNSMKAFVFYTPKYIREYRFDWWFHVAPFIYFLRDGKNFEVVLDKTFFPDGGVEISDWASAFMESKAHCPEIKKYQEYENPPADADCLVRKVPMYYYTPDQVEKLDKENIQKTSFDPADIGDSRTEMWRRRG